MPLSESRKRANKKWNDAHKEEIKKMNYRSKARTFINKLSDQDDLNELKELIAEREDELSKK